MRWILYPSLTASLTSSDTHVPRKIRSFGSWCRQSSWIISLQHVRHSENSSLRCILTDKGWCRFCGGSTSHLSKPFTREMSLYVPKNWQQSSSPTYILGWPTGNLPRLQIYGYNEHTSTYLIFSSVLQSNILTVLPVRPPKKASRASKGFRFTFSTFSQTKRWSWSSWESSVLNSHSHFSINL